MGRNRVGRSGPVLWVGISVAAACLCGAGAAQAQQPQPVPQTDIARQPGPLSDRLGATGGVIRPETAVDPDMEKAAPATGSTPVIPPSAVPGNPVGAQPK